jgi:hypothetical protein
MDFLVNVVYSSAMSASWPSQCNTYYAWIWISTALDGSISVGVGPIPGQNYQASDLSLSPYDNFYLILSALSAGTPLTYYVYQPIIA